jgi:hypothetical protein
VVDRAVGELLAAGQGPDVVVEISARRLEPGCRLTASRDGATLERSVIVRTVVEAAPAVLDRIAERLPAGYHAGVWQDGGDTTRRLRADAGEFVAVAGHVTSAGVVTLLARTGCRPQSPGFDPGADPRPVAGGRYGAESVLRGMRAGQIERHGTTAVRCPDGSVAWTERASGRTVLGPVQRARLTGAPGAVVVIDTAARLAVSAGSASVDAQMDGDRVGVVSTEGCRAR